jgi:hypothetical protein
VPKSRGKLNDAPFRKIVISFDPPIDSTSKLSVHEAPKPDSPAAKRAEPNPREADASSGKFRREQPERPRNLLFERYLALKRRDSARSAGPDEPKQTEQVDGLTSGKGSKK